MEVRLLGPLQAFLSGQLEEVSIGSRQQRHLLAILAIADGNAVSEDSVAQALWEQSALPSNPQATVRTYVSRLRGLLGSDLIESHPAGYALGPDVQVDVREAEHLLRSGSNRLAEGDPAAAADLLTAGLALWRGETLAEMADESWAIATVQRLAELRLAGRENLGAALNDLGRHDEAIADLRALVEHDPLREGAWRQLMLALHGSDRQAEALRAFQDYRTRLAEETGLEPSPELVRLEAQIVRRDPDLAPTARPRRLAGYELGEKVGEGAFGAIYRAVQPSVGREVAIKVVRSELANDPEFVRRFEVEAQTIARLEHPHIVPLHDYWRDPSGAYLVMRYLRGGTAEQALVRDGPLRLEQVARLVEEIGGALAMAHASGIVHRDVKPSNVLFDESGNSYLADFGIATVAGDSEAAELRSAGSPLYAAPEQVRDGTASTASDIYAFGVLLHELLTGVVPYGDSSSIELLFQRKLVEPPPSVRIGRPDLPAAIDLTLQTALARDPGQRFASMSEFVLAFRTAAAQGVDARTTGAPGPRPREAAGRTLVSVQMEAMNPYKGLAAFDESDAQDFFGRELLADQLTERLESVRFLVVTGPSGSGKSSAVRAGLLPRARAEGTLVASMLPGAHPLDELETALLRLATSPVDSLMDQLQADDRGISRAVKRIVPPGSELLLVLDQFEELFTLSDAEERDAFLRGLRVAVSDERSALKVVATLRADFYDRPLQNPEISELVRANTVAISPLDGEELEAAITRPAARLGVTVEPALVAQLIAEVRDRPASLPLLQYSVTELFERRVDGVMTVAAYRQIGGLAGALAQRADTVLEEMDSAQREESRRLFTRLISPGEGTEDTRRRVLRSELTGVGSEVIDAFGTARLLTFDNDPSSREPTVEVAHEALIREWPRLRSWLDDDRDGLRLLRHLSASAAEWERTGRPDSELYRGGRLEVAQDWAVDHSGDLTELERNYLGESLRLKEETQTEERQRLRRLHTLLAVSAVIAAVALLAGAVAFQQRRNATREADAAAVAQTSAEINADLALRRQGEAQEAQDAADVARSAAETRRLSSEAGFRVTSDRQVGLLLAAEAWRRAPGPESLGALQRVLTNIGTFQGVLLAGVPVANVRWLDDDRIVAGGPAGIFEVRVSTGEVLSQIDARSRVDVIDPGDAAFATKGFLRAAADTIAYLEEDDSGTVLVIGVGDRAGLALQLSHDRPVDGLEISHDGSMLATIDADDTLRLFDLPSGDLRWRVEGHPEEVFGDLDLPDRYQPAGNYIIGLSAAPESADEADRLGATSVEMIRHHIRFSGDGAEVLTQEGLLRRWSTEDGGQIGDDVAIWRDRGFGADSTPLVNRVLSFLAGEHEGRVLAYDEGGLVLLARDGSVLAQGEVDTGGDAFGLPKVNTVQWVGGDIAHLLMTDGRVLTVEIATGEIVEDAIDTQINAAADLAVTSDGSTAAVASAEGVGLFALDGERAIARAVPRLGTTGGGVTPDGRYVAMGYSDISSFLLPKLVYDLEEETLLSFDRPDLFSVHVGYGTAGYAGAVTAGLDMLLVDPATLAPRSVEFDSPGAWNGQAISNDGRRVALATGFDGIRVFEVGSGELVRRLGGLGGLAPSVSFSADDARIAAVDTEGKAMVWETTDWTVVDDSLGEGGTSIAALAYSPDGRWLVTFSLAGDIALRDPTTHEIVHELAGNAELEIADSTIFFFEGSRYMVTAADGTPQLWDLEALEAIGDTFPNDPDNRVEGSIGRPAVVTAVGDHRLIWDLRVELWPGIACQLAGRNLTQSEWQRFGPPGEDYSRTCEQWEIARPGDSLGSAAFYDDVEVPVARVESSELEAIAEQAMLDGIAALSGADGSDPRDRCDALHDSLAAAAGDPALLEDSGIDDNPFHRFYTIRLGLRLCAGGSHDRALGYLIDARDNPYGACAGYPSPCHRTARDR